MTWRVFVRASAETDFEALDPGDQVQLAEELFSWVEHGPPRQERRDVLGVEMFNDVVMGCRVTYYVDAARGVVLVIRIRKLPGAAQ